MEVGFASHLLLVQMALERKHGKLHVRLAPSQIYEMWASVRRIPQREMRNIIITAIALSGKLTHNEMKMRWCGSFSRPPLNFYYTLPTALAACAHVHGSWKQPLHGSREVHFAADSPEIHFWWNFPLCTLSQMRFIMRRNGIFTK